MRKIDTSTLLNYLILLYAFSIPVSLDLIRIFAPLILIVWFFEGDMRAKFIAISKEPVFRAIGFLILLLTLSLLWTDPENLKIGIKYVTRFWYLLPALAIFTSVKETAIPSVIKAFLAGILTSVIISYLVYFHLIPFEKFDSEGASPLMHHTLYSIFLVFSIGIVLYETLIKKQWAFRLLYGGLFILFTINLFLNIGRAGQLLFPFILATVILNYFKVTFKSVMITLALALGVFFFAFYFNPVFKHKMEMTYHNLDHISYSTSLGARVGLNIVAKDIIAEHPVLGVGAGDYLKEKVKMVDRRYPDRVYVRFLVHYHDQYAEFAVIAGIFGLFSYLFLWVQLYRTNIQTQKIHVIKLLILVTFIMASFIDAMLHLNRPMSLFALFIGLVLAQIRYEKSEVAPSQ